MTAMFPVNNERLMQEAIKLCMQRCEERYRDLYRVYNTPPHGVDNWFGEWMDYLSMELLQSINRDDSIIAGRQQVFDARPRLPRR